MIRVVLGGVYGSPPPAKRKYRQYSPTTLTKADECVKDGGISVQKASKMYNVPMQTLRDRVLGHVDPETTRSGPGPLLTEFEEARLVEHVNEMAKVGYAYTRTELINVASEFVTCLGRRVREKPLSYKWFYGFLGRCPELKVQRPKTISELRARATSKESVDNYFSELHSILVKYNLMVSPESLYNVDEKRIQQTFKPSFVVGPADAKASVITSEKSNTTTILGCGNALGQQIPPYFVFAGRCKNEVRAYGGASSGAQGTVSKCGWSNGELFKSYLESHFIKYAVGKRPLLLLYDGHRSHISPDIIDWAIEHDIILYFLPPHTSHILQPMDVGCCGPLSKIYSNECVKFQRETGKTVDKYSGYFIACKAYATALSLRNLQSAFKKSGIYPFCPDSIDKSLFETNQLRSELQSSLIEEVCQSDGPEMVQTESDSAETITYVEEIFVAVPLVQSSIVDTNNVQNTVSSIPTCSGDASSSGESNKITSFFKKKRPVFQPPFKKERKSISKIISVKAITEPETSMKVKDYIASMSIGKKIEPVPVQRKTSSNTTVVVKKQSTEKLCTQYLKPAGIRTNKNKQIQSTSGIHNTGGPIDLNTPIQSDDDFTDDEDEEKCCMCGRLQPEGLVNCPGIVFVKWAQCDMCKHWTHLTYCSNVRVIRRGDTFRCPYCH